MIIFLFCKRSTRKMIENDSKNKKTQIKKEEPFYRISKKCQKNLRVINHLESQKLFIVQLRYAI